MAEIEVVDLNAMDGEVAVEKVKPKAKPRPSRVKKPVEKQADVVLDTTVEDEKKDEAIVISETETPPLKKRSRAKPKAKPDVIIDSPTESPEVIVESPTETPTPSKKRARPKPKSKEEPLEEIKEVNEEVHEVNEVNEEVHEEEGNPHFEAKDEDLVQTYKDKLKEKTKCDLCGKEVTVHGLKYTHKKYCKGVERDDPPPKPTLERSENTVREQIQPTEQDIARYLLEQKRAKQTQKREKISSLAQSALPQ
jgi:hypothetical protein